MTELSHWHSYGHTTSSISVEYVLEMRVKYHSGQITRANMLIPWASDVKRKRDRFVCL